MLNKTNSFNSFVEENDKKNRLSNKLDKYTLFFIFENKVYGSTEDNRLIFAKMKNKDEDLPWNWNKELGFQAEEIESLLLNDNEIKKRIFYSKNIPSIKIVDINHVINKFAKKC
jgi:hypothetical protein